jgi:hypothetical protein
MPTDPYAPRPPVAGKPIIKSYPSPDLADRIWVVRKDSRAAGYELPAHGDAYEGPEAEKMDGFIFATAVPSDQTGWVDWYYLDARSNEDAYNALVEYPYADKDYPRVTRTYTHLRSEVFLTTPVDAELSAEPPLPVEQEADDEDPVYAELLLVDHKIIRFEDPILDSLFVNVQRVYERLPSPVITTYDQTAVKQVVTIETQEVVAEDVPVSSATTEVLKVERTTTAKARVTTGTVPDVFPADEHSIEIPDVLPIEMRAVIPTVTEAANAEGDAVLPTLATGELKKTETQVNEFVKRSETVKRANVLPKTLVDKDIEHLSQGRFGEGFSSEGTVTKRAAVGNQNLDTGKFVTDSEVRNLGDGTTMKVTHAVTDWPILRERTVDEVEGYTIYTEKKVVDPLNAAFGPAAAPGAYVDIMPYDRWRSIQITTRVGGLPAEETYATFIDVNLPPTLLQIVGNYVETGGSSQEVNDRFEDGGIAKVTVSAGAMGSIAILAKHNFRGKCFGYVTRHWFAAPPSKEQLEDIGAKVKQILPSDGSVTLISKHANFSQGRGADYAEDSNNGEMKIETVDVSGYLTGGADGTGYHVVNGEYHSHQSVAQATTADGDVAQLYLPGPIVKMYVNIPPSTPGRFKSGEKIVVDVQVSKRRFGMWLVEVFQAVLP